jgi:putative nucleotidyltransferase with HDIG domain
MRIDRRLFRSKLAHRVFLAFVLCAVIPIGVVAVVSYQSVTGQLIGQASTRLRQASKALGLSLFERLLFAETELIAAASAMPVDQSTDLEVTRGKRLSQIDFVDFDTDHPSREIDESKPTFQIRQREEHLAKGRSILLPYSQENDSSPVRLARRLEPKNPNSIMVVGELDPIYFWGLDSGNPVPADAQFCVFDGPGRLIFGSFDGCPEAWAAVHEGQTASDEKEKEIVFSVRSMSDELFVAGHRELFLRARFFASDWMIVVCEPRSAVVQPIERWRLVFPAVVLLAMWLVLLMIIVAIRKNLDPIDQLREGTAHLAERDFDYEVIIQTGDEFEELAGAFNQMSNRLKRQFSALAATGKMHRGILSSFKAGEIVEVTIGGVLDYFECDRTAVIILQQDCELVSRNAAARDDGGTISKDDVAISPGLRTELDRVPPGAVIGHDVPALAELAATLDLLEMKTVFAVPVFTRGLIAAVIGLGFEKTRILPEEDLEYLSQLADQFAVALSNARMLEEVNDFSIGTLEALARAVDAKSPWTAGHSERVTNLAVIIGVAYGLDSSELSWLHRGALLHDIGKLGISRELLDKKGRLDHEEFNIVRSHTTIGERILEPINAFAKIMPIVSQHHEHFDGSGYPNGLAGSEIDIKARILAVADVYDAMTSPRPYRDGVEPSEVVEVIRTNVGSHFDPEVVSAFLRVIDSRGGIESPVMLKRDFSFIAQYDTERDWNNNARLAGRNS